MTNTAMMRCWSFLTVNMHTILTVRDKISNKKEETDTTKAIQLLSLSGKTSNET